MKKFKEGHKVQNKPGKKKLVRDGYKDPRKTAKTLVSDLAKEGNHQNPAQDWIARLQTKTISTSAEETSSNR